MNLLLLKYRLNLLISLFVLLSFVSFSQDNIPPVPKKQTSLYDYANMLNKNEKNTLEQKLIKYNDTTSTQIVVATIKSLNGNDIALFATNWAHKWEIGQKGEDNGVFLLIAKDDRKITIRIGYGVEHKLTDAYSKRIIEQVIKPEFKKGNFYKGLDKGTTYIIKALSGEFKGIPKSNKTKEIPVIFIIFIIIIIIIIISNIKNGGRGRGYRNAGSILETIILSNSGRSGGFGGGFGGGSGGFGGGFSGGFGGGGFGGGGASGSW